MCVFIHANVLSKDCKHVLPSIVLSTKLFLRIKNFRCTRKSAPMLCRTVEAVYMYKHNPPSIILSTNYLPPSGTYTRVSTYVNVLLIS